MAVEAVPTDIRVVLTLFLLEPILYMEEVAAVLRVAVMHVLEEHLYLVEMVALEGIQQELLVQHRVAVVEAVPLQEPVAQ
jgi:hypothetical protein